MNGGHHGAPDAGSPVFTSCFLQKVCFWMLSCCLALQVRGDHSEQPRRWGDGEGAGTLTVTGQRPHPARQRGCGTLARVC